jgi:prohibitin 1
MDFLFALTSHYLFYHSKAQYDAGELITQREIVSHQIGDALTTRAKEFNMMVEDVALTDISFGPEFTAAIEAKQVGMKKS